MNSKMPFMLRRKMHGLCIVPDLNVQKLDAFCETSRSVSSGMDRKMLSITWKARKQSSEISEETLIKDFPMTVNDKE